jgi:hypothetical protein
MFEPNQLTFAEGIERIKAAVAKSGREEVTKIVTSRDANSDSLIDGLKVENVPEGFTKYQLPVFMTDIPGVQFFLSFGAPESKVAEHSHDEGDGMRFIASGSIHFEGKELTAGDWMFIPKGKRYSFTVGKQGAGMFYCYSCCCA